MIDNTLFYKESGRIGGGAIGLMIGAGVATALVLGFVYAFAIFYIPFIYLNFVLTLAYGAAVGYAVLWGARVGKARNGTAVAVVACLLGLFAVYTQWVFWLFALSSKAGDPTLVWSPADQWRIMRALAEVGVWSFGYGHSEPVKGFLLWLVWIIEAGMITVAAIYVSRLAGAGVFCERCENWVVSNGDEARLELNDDSVKKLQQLAEGSFDSLKAIPLADGESPVWMQISSCSCPTCSELNTLNASIVASQLNTKGQINRKEQFVLGGLLTPSQTLADLRAYWAAGGPTPAEQAPPPAEG